MKTDIDTYRIPYCCLEQREACNCRNMQNVYTEVTSIVISLPSVNISAINSQIVFINAVLSGRWEPSTLNGNFASGENEKMVIHFLHVARIIVILYFIFM